MNFKEIIEVFKQYKDNPEIINDDNYIESFIKALASLETLTETLTDFPLPEDLSEEELIESIEKVLSNKKLIPYAFNNPFLMNILCDTIEIQEFLNFSEDKVFDYIKNNEDIPAGWRNNKELFEYVYENEKDLISIFILEEIFPEINDEILTKYGDVIIEYISKRERIYSKWRGNSNIKLFEYINENAKDLIDKIVLTTFFPEINDEILTKYGEVIIEYISKNIYIDPNWRNIKLFEYINENAKDLIDKIDLTLFFPELNDEILTKYGKYVLKKIKNCAYSLWNEECLFKYLLENDISLIRKMKAEAYLKKDEYIEILAEKIEITKEELKYKLEYLYSKNDEIYKTLDFKILKLDKLNMDLLTKITLYPDIQEKIIKLDDNLIEYFSKIYTLLNVKKYDLTMVIEKVLNNINKNDNYKELLGKLPIEELNDEKLKNLIYVLLRKDNIFNIETIDDLTDINFKNKKNNYFALNENNLDNINETDLKNIIFEKKYSVDYALAEFIYKRYYHNIEELKKAGLDEIILYIIQEFALIIRETSVENLKLIYQESKNLETDFYTSLSLESAIRKKYAKMYIDTLYKVNDKDKSKREYFQNVTYNGKPITFYEVDGDFNMQIHVLGAYSHWTNPDNYKEDWNRPKISYHGICTSYIGNNQIATARQKGPILGFSNYEEAALLLGGNYDLASYSSILKYSISMNKPYNLLPPKTMINSTRHNHNEMVIERINKDTIVNYKRNPDYIVYIIDDINNQNNFSEENEYYQQILQASTDMDLPIVIVDRLKYAKSELNKCERLEEKFYQYGNIEDLEELFLTYMNNGVGCRYFDGQIRSEYHNIFSEEKINEFYQRIFNYISEKCLSIKDSNLSYEEISKTGNQILTLIELINHEKTSYAVSHKTGDLEPNLEKCSNELKILYDKYRVYVKEIGKTFNDTEYDDNYSKSK